MRSLLLGRVLLACCFGAVLGPVMADESQPVREIFVPYADLDLLIDGHAERVFVSREEYQDLLARAKPAEPEAPVPRDTLLVSADYQIRMAGERAFLQGALEVEVLAPGLHAVPLDLDRVGLLSASLDGAVAVLGRGEDGGLRLFVEGVGRHALTLEGTTRIEASAAQQAVSFRVPTPAATQLRLTVPGNVEMRSPALSRSFDEAAGATSFELPVARGDQSLVMSLNNRTTASQQVVEASSVIVDEVTQAAERLHATLTMRVLRGAVTQFRFRLPAGLEVTDVSAAQVSRWGVLQPEDGEGRILEVQLHEPLTDSITLGITAASTSAGGSSRPLLGEWVMPRIEPLDVASHTSLLGLLLDERLAAESFEAVRLIPIDTAVFAEVLPASVMQAEPGAATLRAVGAWLATDSTATVRSQLKRPPSGVDATTATLLTLREAELRLRATVSLSPRVDPLFAVKLRLPSGWEVTGVNDAQDASLAFAPVVGGEKGASGILVRLPHAVAAGGEVRLSLEATRVPDGWLDAWAEMPVVFPMVSVEGAERGEGAVAITATDDLAVQPQQIAGVIPLARRELEALGLSADEGTFAYRLDGEEVEVRFLATRKTPSLTARSFHFFRIENEAVATHAEVLYDIQRAAATSLSFSLPSSTPKTISLRGLQGVQVTEFSSREEDGRRVWTARLADRTRGQAGVSIDFEEPLSVEEQTQIDLPCVIAEGVAYQSAAVAVEGNPEVSVSLATEGRRIDVGELVDAEAQVGRRLLGVYGFSGTAAVTAEVERRPGYGLPTAITQRAALVTLQGANGTSQTAARFLLRTNASFLQLTLPAGANLWSITIDGSPSLPQRDGEDLLVSLPNTSAQQVLRDVTIVYEMASTAYDWRGLVREEAPLLAVRSEDGSTRFEVPLADVEWQVVLPDGYRVVRSDGSVFAASSDNRPWSLTPPLRLLAEIGGGIEPLGVASPLLPQAARPSQLLLARRKDAVATDSEALPLAASDAPAAPMSPELPALADKAELFDQDSDAKAKESVLADGFAANAPMGMASESAPTDPASQPASAPQTNVYFAEPSQESFRWALEGVRSLPIELGEQGHRVTFVSLGGRPVLSATLVQETRLLFVAAGLAVLVAACGVVVVGRSWRARARVVASAILLTLAVPTAVELTTGFQLHELFQPAFFIAVVALPCYVAIDLAGWVTRRVPLRAAADGGIGLLVGLTLLAAGEHAAAQDGEPPAGDMTVAEFLEKLDPREPVSVPENAVIVPYDGGDASEDPQEASGTLPSAAALAAADKVLIPFAEYARLKAIAEGNGPEAARPLPSPFAFAGASYTARLIESGELVINGLLELEVYSKETVEVPLRLHGGVLERAMLDRKPALLRLVEPLHQPAEEAAQQAVLPPHPGEPMVVLTAEGIGRHQLNLTIRLPLEQRGGWRSIRGQLPFAPATRLSLRVPAAETELRVVGADGLITQQTRQAEETVETALAADASISVEWRSKVSAARVDEALTARSLAVVDVREDGVHAAWQLDLDVRQGQREVFTLEVPEGWLVEAVQGPKVRGWEISRREREDGAVAQQIDVTLLEPASGNEQLWVRLSLPVDVVFDGASALALSAVGVPEAVLHQGFLVLRRGPLVDLRVVTAEGLVRDDPPADRLGTLLERFPDDSPLAVRSFQAYRFANERFDLAVAARSLQAQLTADVQTLVRISERESTYETRLACVVDDRPLHRVRVDVPAGVTVDRVSCPGLSGWTLVSGEDTQLVIDLVAGAKGPWSVTITGTLEGGPSVAAPAFVLPEASRQTSTVVVQADPSMSVDVVGLENAEVIPLPRTFDWLAAEQRSLARLAVFARGAAFSARFRVSRRQPIVTAVGLTNVQVTPRELVETVLLRFEIAEAGIRELAFLLPEALQHAEVHVPLLLEKSVEPVAEQPGMVRFRVRLQDDVIGTLAVLVEQTGPLREAAHEAALPKIETGSTQHRFVVFENQGRDEIVVTESNGVREVSRQQAAWRDLASILPGMATQAYLVAADAEAPKLSFALRSRSLVESAGARIGLALTTLSVDGGGVYRATQEYRIDNKTEQLLEVELPEGAALWSAVVAGEPVKPTAMDAADTRRVGIPLIKTQAGDLDYAVVLTYGGTLGPLERTASLRFPFVKTVNINVEQSQVRLWLPETHRWFAFDGTLRMVGDADELTADFLAYQNKKMQQLMQVASSESQDVFSRVRARSNALQLGESLQGYVSNFRSSRRSSGVNDRLERELMANSSIVEEAQVQAGQMPADAVEANVGNGTQLWSYFQGQDVARGTNVVNELNLNFDASGLAATPQSKFAVDEKGVAEQAGETSSLNRRWVDTNWFGRTERGAVNDAEQAAGERQLAKSLDELSVAGADRRQAGVGFEEIEKKRSFGRGGERDFEDSSKPQQQRVELRDQVQRYQQRLAQDGIDAPMQADGQSQRQLAESINGPGSGALGDVRLVEEAEQQQLGLARQFGTMGGRAGGGYGGGYGGMGGVGGGAASRFGSGVAPSSSTAAGLAAVTEGRAVEFGTAPQAGLGLASLDVTIPTRGREYLFTTPRGDLVITAEAVDERVVDRGTRLGLVLAGLLVVWLIAKIGIALWGRLGPRVGGLLLILLGLASMLSSTLPVLGVAVAACGVVALIKSFRRRVVAVA